MARQGSRGPCKTCAHPQRARIDYLIAKGAAINPLAAKFGLSHDALRRHAINHVTDDYRRSIQIGPFKSEDELRKIIAESSGSVLENLRSIYGGLADRWLTSYEAGNDINMIALTGRLHQNLELQARLTKELAPTPSTLVQNFFHLPQFSELQATLLRVLSQHPDARAAVIRAFRDLERKSPAMIEVAATDAKVA